MKFLFSPFFYGIGNRFWGVTVSHLSIFIFPLSPPHTEQHQTVTMTSDAFRCWLLLVVQMPSRSLQHPRFFLLCWLRWRTLHVKNKKHQVNIQLTHERNEYQASVVTTTDWLKKLQESEEKASAGSHRPLTARYEQKPPNQKSTARTSISMTMVEQITRKKESNAIWKTGQSVTEIPLSTFSAQRLVQARFLLLIRLIDVI